MAVMILTAGNKVPTKLLSLLAETTQWHTCTIHPSDVGTIVVKMKNDSVLLFNEVTLDAIDGRLWTALTHLVNSKPSALLVPVLLNMTIHHWLGLYPKYPDTVDDKRYVITHFHKVEYDAASRQNVRLRLSLGAIQSVNMIEVVTAKHYDSAKLSYSWLEGVFPGSIGRLKQAARLDLSQPEQAHYMVHGIPVPITKTTLPDDLVLC